MRPLSALGLLACLPLISAGPLWIPCRQHVRRPQLHPVQSRTFRYFAPPNRPYAPPVSSTGIGALFAVLLRCRCRRLLRLRFGGYRITGLFPIPLLFFAIFAGNGRKGGDSDGGDK